MAQRGSLTSTILRLMLVLIFISSSLAVYSIINLSFSIGDARAINASGSLRMQSYRLKLFLEREPQLLNEKINQFEETLDSEALQRSNAWYSPKELSDQYLLVIDKWQQMRYFIENNEKPLYTAALKDFVDTIDLLVLEMERFAAFKLRALVISQIIGLFLMLIVASFATRYTRKKMVQPILQLMDVANSISKGKFNVEVPATDYIELHSLGVAFKKTAAELDRLYQDLEGQVNEKTTALTRANNELSFLYDNLIMLHADRLDYKALGLALNQLQQFESLDFLRLVIEHDDHSIDTIEADTGWPSPEHILNKESKLIPVKFDLKLENKTLGYLEVISLKPINNMLFVNFAMMLTRSIVIHNATEERQQLALMEERAVIARELHDSLGQLLSYLKIQVSLLGKQIQPAHKTEKVASQLADINEGVSVAYGQLRELLSTFRLTIKEPNLNQAIEVMISELRKQSGINIELKYSLSQHLFASSQHIHVLHLMREATINAIKHAKPNKIVIDCFLADSGMIQINIKDDGIGVSHLKERDQHFGIGIMHERATKLHGTVKFDNNPQGGTTVSLVFPPQQEPLNG
ncbi:nitrate/nitrite two-component system sensor histidine kinase NarQ [Shewanella sp. 10N.286.51.B2]|uniref:nitrate/nitrite two-component system sensor histidine kinase NarQ n=1 Tax=unclassified Shewanella TaxID=196818 RepID=UPI0026E2972B|nr:MULTISPECIES: nitrate/nitrite two-component system sensor histidine kinase NarQ [unclassified Shewanella]MDO6639931.1 nitrate/nitrite two-component system sensor histidine kinase NarQ [Shewanella sp. 5_MG-2023]MDO6678279.1 nitrate/nitrite two-component system sensor histidine kinase NarQ [Shewanella sp. 4_MG-2023]